MTCCKPSSTADDISGFLADAFLVAVTRIGGIVGGVLITLVLAVTVFPKSASHEAADTMSAALQGLMQLYALAWNMDWSEEEKASSRYHRQASDSGGCVRHRDLVNCSASADVHHQATDAMSTLPGAACLIHMPTSCLRQA